MMQRCYDPDFMRDIVVPFDEGISYDFDFEEWVEDENNVALEEGDNIGVFEFEYPGVFSGHYFFATARGRKAKDLAIRMLTEMFSQHGARTIKGMTPVENKAARWMTRQLGFKSYGVFDTPVGDYELFCITLDEFFHHLHNGEDHD